MFIAVYSLAETPKPPPPPPPAFGLIYEGAIGQPKKTTFLCDPLLTKNATVQPPSPYGPFIKYSTCTRTRTVNIFEITKITKVTFPCDKS
jgi:hypothetical protein